MMNLLMDSKVLSADSLIHHFCEMISEEQWMLLKSGSPDAAFKIQIAELVLGMIKVLTTNVLTAMETMKLSLRHKPKEEVVDAVTEVIAHVSLQTLSFFDKMDSVQSKCLSKLITTEVAESITSSLCATSAPPSSFLELEQDVVNPYRLNAMVTHAANMFKHMKVKVKALLCHRHKSHGPGISESEEEKEVKGKQSCQQKSFLSKMLASMKRSESEMNGGVQNEIRNTASAIVTPLIGDLPQKEVEDLLCEIGEEAESLSEDISAVLSNKTSNRLRKKIKSRIKNFFTNCITKVWRCRMLEQLKNKYKPESHRASSPLVESLVENISSQLQLCVYKNEQRPKKVYVNAPIDDVNTFVEDLYCMINRYFTADEARAKVERLSVATRRNLCWDFQNKVWIFVALMNWWLTTQVNDLSEKVMLTDRQQVPKTNTKIDREEGEGEKGASAHITQETLVYHLVENTLWRIYKKTHLYPENRHYLHSHLCELICSNMEKEDLRVPLQDLNSISDRIYKDLCRKWGDAHNVVALLNLQNQDLDMCIVSIFRYQLTRPPKKLRVVSFFRSCIRSMFTCCF